MTTTLEKHIFYTSVTSQTINNKKNRNDHVMYKYVKCISSASGDLFTDTMARILTQKPTALRIS